MLKLLLKKQLTEIFRNYFYDPKKNRARSKAGIVGYILLFVIIMVGILGGMFTSLSLLKGIKRVECTAINRKRARKKREA